MKILKIIGMFFCTIYAIGGVIAFYQDKEMSFLVFGIIFFLLDLLLLYKIKHPKEINQITSQYIPVAQQNKNSISVFAVFQNDKSNYKKIEIEKRNEYIYINNSSKAYKFIKYEWNGPQYNIDTTAYLQFKDVETEEIYFLTILCNTKIDTELRKLYETIDTENTTEYDSIICSVCQNEVSHNSSYCPNCGNPLKMPKELNLENQPINPTLEYKKSNNFQVIFITLCLLCLASVFILPVYMNYNKKNNAETTEKANVIEDVEQYSNISTKHLKKLIGKPKDKEKWTNKTLHGDFKLITLSYIINSNLYEFIIADNTVVRLTIYSGDWWNRKKEKPFKYSGNEKDIIKMFNVHLDKNAIVTCNNGFTYRIADVNAKIEDFNVQEIDSDNDTFGFVKITFNSKYFD